MLGVHNTELLLGLCYPACFIKLFQCFLLFLSQVLSNTHENPLVGRNQVPYQEFLERPCWWKEPAPGFTQLAVTLPNTAALGEGRTKGGVEKGQGGRWDGN